MKFCEFVQLMHWYIGCDKEQQEYLLCLTSLIIRDPMTDYEEKLGEEDKFNLLSGKSTSYFSNAYTGENGRKTLKQNTRVIQIRFSKTKFVD